jgi:RND family efflux transporter MFP subunit
MGSDSLRQKQCPGEGHSIAGCAGRSGRGASRVFVAALACLALLSAGCQPEEEAPPPIRMVRTITVAEPAAAADIRFTGQIEAQDQASLSFRIGGRLAERAVGVGATVRQDEVVARLDPENELNELRSAQSALTTAQAQLRKADNALERQTHLFARNVTTRADFEAAEQSRRAAEAQVTAAQSRVRTAEDIVAFTTLRADAPGVVTRVGAEAGEVVPAGRMIVQLARREGRDAVFDVSADLVRTLRHDANVYVTLAGETAAAPVLGRVREVAPQADPVTRTFRVRVGLTDPPASFRLGSAVTATILGGESSSISIPATALTQREQGLGVWIVDPQTLTVSMRKIDVLDSDPATARIAGGLSIGDIVVTAGAGSLDEGQKVHLAGTETPGTETR